MKKSILFFLLIACGLLQSQNYTYAYHSGIASSFGMVGLNGKTYHLERTTVLNQGCTDAISLVCIQNGKVLFRKLVAAAAYMSKAGISLSPQKEIIVSCGTYMMGCDYTGTFFNLVKMDTLGNILWKVTENFSLLDLVVLQDSMIYINTGNGVLNCTASGQSDGDILGLLTVTVSGVHSIASYDSTHFIMNYNDQGSKLLLVASDLSHGAPVAVSATLHAIQKLPGGGLAALSGHELQVYSPSFVFKKGSSAAMASHTINAFTHRNDSFFVTGVDLQKRPFFAVLDSQLVPLHIYTVNIADGYGTGVYVEGTAAHFITTGGVREYEHSYTTHLQTSFNTTASPGKDIGVSSASITGSQLMIKYGYFGSGYYVYRMSANVTVKNFGTDTVRAFHLNHFSRDFYPYGYKNNGFNREYSATIAPGGSITVTTGTFYTTCAVFGAPSGTFATNICFRSSVPDSLPDLAPLNDGACAGYVVVLTDIEEEGDNAVTLSVYPNPSKGNFTIVSDVVPQTLEVRDVHGRLVFSELPAAQTKNIDLRNCASGIYFLSVKTSRGNARCKLVIE